MFFGKIKESLKNLFKKQISKEEFERFLIDLGFSYSFIKEIVKDKNFLDAFYKKLENIINFSFSLDYFLKFDTFLFLGPNGSGKTSSIVKFAYYLLKSGKINKDKFLIVGADTYRAGAQDQLKKLAQKVNLNVYLENGKPASIVYKALEENKDKYIFIDTSGRLETNKNLLKEIFKIYKVCQKFKRKILSIYILDATYGKHAKNQIKIFKSYLPIDGLGITKFDISKKIGFIFEVIKEYNLPIFFISYGENLEDISIFNKKEFLKNFQVEGNL